MNQLGKVYSRRLVVIKYIVKPLPRKDTTVIIHPAIQNHDTMLWRQNFAVSQQWSSHRDTHSSAGCLVLFASVAQQFTSLSLVTLTGFLINVQFVPLSLIYIREASWHECFSENTTCIQCFSIHHQCPVGGGFNSIEIKITLCMAFDVLQGFYWFNYDVSEHIKHVPFSIVYWLIFLLKCFCTSTHVSSRRLDAIFFSRWCNKLLWKFY